MTDALRGGLARANPNAGEFWGGDRQPSAPTPTA